MNERVRRAITALRTPDASLKTCPNTIRQSIADIIEELVEKIEKPIRKEPVIIEPHPGELAACPFCGSAAGLEHDAEGTYANWRVYCRDTTDAGCPISLTNTRGTARRVEAVTMWNRRQPLL